MQRVESMGELAPVVYMVLPDGTADVWMRKNFSSEQREEGQENGMYTVYVADEVFFKVKSDEVPKQEIETEFETWFEFGENFTMEKENPDYEKIGQELSNINGILTALLEGR